MLLSEVAALETVGNCAAQTASVSSVGWQWSNWQKMRIGRAEVEASRWRRLTLSSLGYGAELSLLEKARSSSALASLSPWSSST